MENKNEIFEEEIKVEEKIEETTEESNAAEKKPLPWWIFAIIGAAVVAIAVVLILLLGGKKCEHVDKDDDFLCDECGAEFDDGLEIITADVTFILKDEAGEAMAGIKFTARNKKTSEKYNLTTGADGKATVTLPVGNYSVEYDYDTIPSGFQPNLPELRVEESTSNVDVTVVNNNRDGSAERPFVISEDVTAVTIEAGQEIFYECRVGMTRKMKIDNESIVITYNGETYTSEFVIVNTDGDVDFVAVFSIKNTSDAMVETEIETIYDPGTKENPFEFDENPKTISLNSAEAGRYYAYTATEDGVLVIASDNNKVEVQAYKINSNDVPSYSDANDDENQCLAVTAGETIYIILSNSTEDPQSANITLTTEAAE